MPASSFSLLLQQHTASAPAAHCTCLLRTAVLP